jgi:hypothetical protein
LYVLCCGFAVESAVQRRFFHGKNSFSVSSALLAMGIWK